MLDGPFSPGDDSDDGFGAGAEREYFDDRLPVDMPDAVDRVLEVETMLAVFAAERLVKVAAMHDEAVAKSPPDGRTGRDLVERSIRLELAAATRMTEYAAGELLSLAHRVVHRYPEVLTSLSRANMTERHARILVDALDVAGPEFAAELLPQAIELAEREPVGTFRRRLTHLVDTVRESTLAERHREALQKRRVVLEQGDDSMSWLMVHLPTVEARAIFDRATAIAKRVKAADADDARTLDQVRADVIADLLIDGQVAAHPKNARGIQASVVVTVPALALLSDAENAAPSSEPAVVEGIGPIPLQRARELCGGAKRWMRVLTHPETGMVLSVGRTKYSPPPALQKLTKWRADRCMGPGCGKLASQCDIDHSLDWQYGGSTSLENLAPFCRGHHTVKHHGDWVVRQLEGTGGAIEWISPTGRRYVVEPERRVPIFRTRADGTSPPPPF